MGRMFPSWEMSPTYIIVPTRPVRHPSIHVHPSCDVRITSIMPSLAQILQRLPRLDGQVNRADTIPPLVDGDFITFQGSLNPTEKIIAIKRPRFLSRDDEGVEVMSSFVFAVLESHIYVAFSPRNHHLVTTLRREHCPIPWGCEPRRQAVNSDGIHDQGRCTQFCTGSTG